MAIIPSFVQEMLDNRATGKDINGLCACPECKTLGEVRVQTPPDEDNVVRRVYFRCFACGMQTPEYKGWKPVPLEKSGIVTWAPLRDFFNDFASGAFVAK